MSRPPLLPPELLSAPFTLQQARLAGLTPRQLRSSCWTRLGPARYAWTGLELNERHRLAELRSRLPGTAVFCALTAGSFHALDVMRPQRPQVLVADRLGVSERLNAEVHRAAFAESEVVLVDGYRVTSVLRTIVDIGRWISVVEAVVAADSALHRGLTDINALTDLVESWKRRKGVRRLRRVLDLVEPASESAMETRLRLLLVLAGLPRPLAQVELRDSQGAFLARVDLFYPEAKVVIEYDGGTHRESLVEDNRRQNLLIAAGYIVLRFTAQDVYTRRELTIAQVRRAIRR